MAEFDDLQERVFAPYVEQRFGEMRELLNGAVERFPKWRSRITYWQACVDSRLDDSEQAVERLRRGAEDGMFWPENSLHTDPDLAAARGLTSFEEMLGPLGGPPSWRTRTAPSGQRSCCSRQKSNPCEAF